MGVLDPNKEMCGDIESVWKTEPKKVKALLDEPIRTYGVPE